MASCAAGQSQGTGWAEPTSSDGGAAGQLGDATARDDGTAASDATAADDETTETADASAANDATSTGDVDTTADAPGPSPDAQAGSPDVGPLPIPNPVNCASLSRVVGTWQNVSPGAFSMPPNLETIAVVVNPQDGTVYAAAGNVTNGPACPQGSSCPAMSTGLYRSGDCGATWTAITSKTPGSDSANLFTGDPWALLIDPAEPSVMYMANGYGNNPTIYKSTNGGVDWQALNPDPAKAVGTPYPFVQAMALDPYNHRHLAVTFHANCGAPYRAMCLSESDDAGNTWKQFNGPPPLPGWQEGSSVSILGPSHYLLLGPSGVWYTADGGGTWTQVSTQGVGSAYPGGTHIAPDGTLYVGGGSSVLFSPPLANAVPPFALGSGTPTLSALSNSPGVSVIVDDGVSLFASSTLSSATQEFFTAPLKTPTAWKQMPDAICGSATGAYNGEACRGSNEMAFDAFHNIVYSANSHAGLWRLVTR